MATHGEIQWPPVGRFNGRLWENCMATLSVGGQRHRGGERKQQRRRDPGAAGPVRRRQSQGLRGVGHVCAVPVRDRVRA